MERTFVLIGAVLGFLGVALGAFGAHGLQSRVSPPDLAIFETAVRYQLVHALALALVGALAGRLPGSASALAGWAFFLGVVIFSGSLYTLVLTGVRWLGAITPIGGVALLIGWAALAWGAWRS